MIGSWILPIDSKHSECVNTNLTQVVTQVFMLQSDRCPPGVKYLLTGKAVSPTAAVVVSGCRFERLPCQHAGLTVQTKVVVSERVTVTEQKRDLVF